MQIAKPVGWVDKPNIGRKLNGFVGFATQPTLAARYSDDAKKYVETLLNAKIVLIDGKKLAEYIYQYGLGVQVVQTLSIKKLDADYWDSIPNDE